MSMYNVTEYSDNYSKTSTSLWQYCREEPALNNNDIIINFPGDDNDSIFFEFKEDITGQTRGNGTECVEVIGSIKTSK